MNNWFPTELLPSSFKTLHEAWWNRSVVDLANPEMNEKVRFYVVDCRYVASVDEYFAVFHTRQVGTDMEREIKVELPKIEKDSKEGYPSTMNKQLRAIPKDSILTVTTGEYSDFTVLAVCRALTEIKSSELVREFLSDHPELDEPYKLDSDIFLAWLVNEKQYVEEINSFELYLGDLYSGYISIS